MSTAQVCRAVSGETMFSTRARYSTTVGETPGFPTPRLSHEQGASS
jgi:hypothetical protein